MSDFGTRLKKARKDNKVTQKELSEALGIAQSTIANYENNTRFPGIEILREISMFLNTSLDYLMGVEDKIDQNILPAKEGLDFPVLQDKFFQMVFEYREEEAKELIKESHLSGVDLLTLIEKIFIPILVRVGKGWEEGKITVAQEHIITSIIDKLIDYLSEIQDIEKSINKTAVFMVPGGEEHTLILKMAAEYFKSSGWNIRFIGSSVPINDLIGIIEEVKAEVLVISALSNDSINSASYLIKALREIFGGNEPTIILGGSFYDANLIKSQTDADIVLVSLESLKDEIINLQ